jgi:hypothetical protein
MKYNVYRKNYSKDRFDDDFRKSNDVNSISSKSSDELQNDLF